MKIVDTNFLVRLFTGRPVVQRQHVKEVLLSAKNRSITLPTYVISELVYVLSFHRDLNYPRLIIARGIKEILDHPAWDYDRDLQQAALEIYETSTLDYVDCLVLAEYQLGRAAAVLSFDKKLLKLL